MNLGTLVAATLLLIPMTAHSGNTPTAPRVGGTSRPLPEASTTRQAGERCVLGVCTGASLLSSGNGKDRVIVETRSMLDTVR